MPNRKWLFIVPLLFHLIETSLRRVVTRKVLKNIFLFFDSILFIQMDFYLFLAFVVVVLAAVAFISFYVNGIHP